jgi:hypothetical protein
MAFLKQKETPDGVQGEYWRILHFEPLRSDRKCSVNLVCYKNKDFADLETNDGIKRYLWNAETFYIDYSSLDVKFPTVDQLYQLIKEQHSNYWGDAQDV